MNRDLSVVDSETGEQFVFTCNGGFIQDIHRLRILDLGCGGRKYPGAYGVDSVYRQGVDLVSDAYDFLDSQGSGSADAVIMRQFIEHVNSLKIMEKVGRVLRQGGRVLIETPNSLGLNRILRAIEGREVTCDLNHIQVFSAPELRNLLRITGFDRVKISYFNDWELIRLPGEKNRFLKTVTARFSQIFFPITCRHIRAEGVKL